MEEQPSGHNFSEQENLAYAAQLLGRKTPPAEVESLLIQRGVGSITAHQMVVLLLEQQVKARRSTGIRAMVIGGILVAIGLFVLLTPGGTINSTSRIVAVAAILYGLARGVQGALQVIKK